MKNKIIKIAVGILAVWGCLATLILICLLCVYLDREGIVEFRREPGVNYYHAADVQSRNLPKWDLTNAIPLSADAAIKAAKAYATEKHTNITDWDVDRVSLEKWGDGGGVWYYEVELIDRHSGKYITAYPWILMDGSVWKPTKEKGP